MMPRSADWKIGVRQMLKNDPDFRVEMEKDIRELLELLKQPISA